MEDYSEADFVEYALKQMEVQIISRKGKYFELVGNFSVEVEDKNLYRLSTEGWVISPFDDIGNMIEFIKKNLQQNEQN